MTRFRFVEQERVRYPVWYPLRGRRRLPERLLRLALPRPIRAGRADADLARKIRAAPTTRSRGTYGVPRIHADLAEAGHHVSRKRVARLMRRDRLAGVHRRRFIRTTIRDEHAAPFPDLSTATSRRPGPTGSGSPTSPSYRRGGPCYLAAIVDAWSRRVVGWSMATHMRAELVTAALDAAIVHRRPGTDLIHHSDHGTQYTSLAFGRRLRESGIAASDGLGRRLLRL